MIRFKAGYKYQLHDDYTVKTGVIGFDAVDHEFIYLTSNGYLAFKAGYAWDGCSGPTIDCRTSMRASLVHDALYQLMQGGHLSASLKDQADREFQRVLLEDGFNRVRSWFYYHAVRLFGKTERRAEEILEAP